MTAQFKKGVLELAVLKSAFHQDMYGYELVEAVSKVIGVNEGTIYHLLNRLTNERYFETYLKESTEGTLENTIILQPLEFFIRTNWKKNGIFFRHGYKMPCV